MKLYRSLLLTSVALAIAFAAWHYRSPAPPVVASANVVFTGTVGERFDHDPRITVYQNPHGAADRAYFQFSGRPIGAMFVTAPPPSAPPETMREVVIEHTKKDYGATSVIHTSLTNRNGYLFDRFSSDAHKDGRTYHYELYLHETKPLSPSISDSYLLQMFGMHKFEFIIPSEDAPELVPLIHALIDSFRVVRR